ncbi:DUF3575 domain-containing protein [Winogradskyella maritima]|uniref:DUF3575 domain-containing protein n=1 Tax=Winogradskyella maritima TaxID=1517766 RepID=A0ABV8AFN7_9FLAO|nr:DUF3575 domain-containing protein [Winogradskyella maritima]
MKKIILTVLALSIFITSKAQDGETPEIADNATSEVKLNALFMVVGAFDVTYEYLLNQESGLGIEVFVPFDEEIRDDINYYVSPYYRLYFGKKYAAGFFLEGFGMLNSIKETTFDFSQTVFDGPVIEREENITDFALGIGLGGKWLTNSGFVGELSFGIGRNLFNSSDVSEDFVGKLGITLGYRF